MALIPAVGSKSPKTRVFIILIYTSLIVLGTTMVTPFLITVTGSVSNDFDYERFRPLPRFLWSRPDRFMKCLTPYFNGFRRWTRQMNAAFPDAPAHWSSWSLTGRDISGGDKLAEQHLAAFNADPERQALIAADYAEFCDTYPLSDKVVYASQGNTIGFLTDVYTAGFRQANPGEARKMSGGKLRQAALELLGREWGVLFESFYTISFETEMNYPMDFQGWFPPSGDRKYQAYNSFKQAAEAHAFTPGVRKKWLAFLKAAGYPGDNPEALFPVKDTAPPKLRELWLEFRRKVAPATPVIPFALRTAWYAFLQSEEVGQILGLSPGESFTVDTYNRLAATAYGNLHHTPFPIPDGFPAAIQELWAKFQMERFPLRLVEITPSPELDAKFAAFVENTIRHLHIANELLGVEHESWTDFKAAATPENGFGEAETNRRELWKNFVGTLPAEEKKFGSSEMAYQRFLLEKYGSPAGINRGYGWNLAHVEEAFPPFATAYTATFLHNEYKLAFSPLVDNYVLVMDFLLFNGNAIFVTFVLVALTILCTLTVNPLAAYALSRFNIRGQDKILLFLLATMAFPAMVSAIPAYLLMRDLGLLNTFFALVLPGAANGMAIFILKGFFDSLPMELFEAATIDGASEMQIFRIVAMPLVKPILAVNCLTAFIIAYNGWEWALIICQDKSMWTVAVWLYQASTWWASSPWIVSAGFVVASIPTLILFISSQKIILRGIIIPSMK